MKHQISLSLKFIKNFSQKYCSSSSERLSTAENSAGLHQIRTKNICICRITILVCSSTRDKIRREDRKLQETDQDTLIYRHRRIQKESFFDVVDNQCFIASVQRCHLTSRSGPISGCLPSQGSQGKVREFCFSSKSQGKVRECR